MNERICHRCGLGATCVCAMQVPASVTERQAVCHNCNNTGQAWSGGLCPCIKENGYVIVKELENLEHMKKPGDVVFVPDEGLHIGEFTLRRITTQFGDKPPFVPKPAIWIEKDDGEGMSVDEGKFAALIRWYFKENF